MLARVAAAAISALLAVALIAAQARAATITEYPIPTANHNPQDIAAGADGALWFTETLGQRIGRINSSGAVIEYPLPTANTASLVIAAGSDGALWFTEGGANRIGRITTGGAANDYPLPTGQYTGASGIAAGSDGALWFTEESSASGYSSQIGRITTSGAFSQYPVLGSPDNIAAGPDGALWFTESNRSQIGRITTSGAVTYYPTRTASSGPDGIAAGPDGALWFTEIDVNQIGRISTSGAVTEYPIPTANSGPIRIAAGADGALWFTEQNANKVGRITTSGAVTEYPVPTANGHPVGIAKGPDGALWFIEQWANKIGRITTGTSSLSVGDASVAEPVTGSSDVSVGVSLSAPSDKPVTVDYATHDGAQPDGATSGEDDYTPTQGSLTFAPGETVKTVSVPVNHVGKAEGNEKFSVELSGESGADVAKRVGVVTIGGSNSSSTSVKCKLDPTSATADSCLVTVSDASGVPAHTPTGTVDFSSTTGAPAISSCALVAGQGYSASCTIAYTPPQRAGLIAPDVTASWPGDAVLGPSSGRQTLDCRSGAILKLESVTSNQPHSNGFYVGSTLTLHGCAFDPQDRVYFDAPTTRPVTPTNVAHDGQSMDVTVPIEAISGRLEVQLGQRSETLATPDPLPIDSWRNTQGFSFKNFSAALTRQQFADEFGSSTVVGHTLLNAPVLSPAYEALYSTLAAYNLKPPGRCWGMSLVASQLADGSLPLAAISSAAKVPYDLSLTPALRDRIAAAWLGTFARESDPYLVRQAAHRTQADVRAELEATMPNGDGRTKPAMVYIYHNTANASFAHEETAYGWADSPTKSDPQRIVIYTYDPNRPFAAAESADVSQDAHKVVLGNSWIALNGDGSWSAPGENVSGKPAEIGVMPARQVEGRLHITPGALFGVRNFVPQGVSVESVTTRHGRVDLSKPSPDVVPVMQTNAVPASTTPRRRGSGIPQIAQLLIKRGRTSVSIGGDGHQLGLSWIAHSEVAKLGAANGHLSTSFDSASGELGVTAIHGEASPGSATLTLVNRLPHGQERVLQVSGPARAGGFSTLFTHHGSTAQLAAGESGTYRLALSIAGRGITPQTYALKALRLRPGSMLSLQPRSWTKLATTTLSATLRAPRGAVRRIATHRQPNPAVTVVGLRKTSSKKITLTVRTPTVTGDQTSVSLLIVVRAHRQIISRGVSKLALSAARPRTLKLTVTLDRAIAAKARAEITGTTLTGGTTPSLSVSKLTRTIG